MVHGVVSPAQRGRGARCSMLYAPARQHMNALGALSRGWRRRGVNGAVLGRRALHLPQAGKNGCVGGEGETSVRAAAAVLRCCGSLPTGPYE